MKLTKTEAVLITQYLKHQFPWLGTQEGEYPNSGADVIEQLESAYTNLLNWSTA